MIRADPRRRNNPDEAAPKPPASSILLRGDDDEPMDVDEALPESLASADPTSLSSDPTTATRISRCLITPIITPSPYPQHNAGPTSTRFKNALHRVTLQPTRDVEAWQAILTEAHSCYKQLMESPSPVTPHETLQRHLQLDWIESCYGYLLQNYPYAWQYHVRIAQLLWAQSASAGDGPDRQDLAVVMEDEQSWIKHAVGTMAHAGESPHRGTPTPRAALCEQKLAHLLTQTLGFDLEGKALAAEPMEDGPDETPPDAQESADDKRKLGTVCQWCVELWLVYVCCVARHAQRRFRTEPVLETRRQAIRDCTQQAFELAVQHAGGSHNNQILWKHYLAFVRSWTVTADPTAQHVLAQQQMVQLRSVYQRAVCLPMTGLDQLWNEYEAFERAQNEALAQALAQEFSPKYQHARTVYLERNRVYGSAADLQLDRLATDPVTDAKDDYAAKMNDEYRLLRLWKIRVSYQRTNPERLTVGESAQRIRQACKEMVCVFTRHPECWHQWSMWELCGAENKSPERAIAVLQLAQKHIPDSTLLAYAEAQIVELTSPSPAQCIDVMERLLARSPSTLAFVICQQLVRRYRGVEEARAVFAKARRVLGTSKVSAKRMEDQPNVEENLGQAGEPSESNQTNAQRETTERMKGMVTNRLDPSIGKENVVMSEQKEDGKSHSSKCTITWHLYASHAAMEHRLNGSREIAARIYELGLRKHGDFLTKPPYVMRYAQLLLELGDTINLRALLRRSVAACEDQNKEGSLAALWDMSLYFESLLDSDVSSASRLDDIERKRRAAVLGPDLEDVATGGLLSSSDVPLIGAQKTSISEQLIRTEGYDVSSKIVSGMSRALDFLDVSGFWGSDGSTFSLSRKKMKQDIDFEISAGVSDALYQKRAQFLGLAASGAGMDAVSGESGAGAKLLSARERLQQQSIGLATGQTTAMMLVIQQSPDWLRPLLLMLPASKLRLPIVPKPPPHLTEMALAMLRYNNLPAERPPETSSNKRAMDDTGGDSSDEENGDRRGGGYGSAFRSRQRGRLTADSSALD